MSRDEILSENLLALPTVEHARMSFEDAVRGFPTERINEKLPNAEYSAWGLLEHLRRAQEDILDFMRNPEYRERSWPADYWPEPAQQATRADWDNSVRAFKRDIRDIQDILRDPKTEVDREIPWGEGITVLREIVTLANHNAFHLGEFSMMRQSMGTWGKSHR